VTAYTSALAVLTVHGVKRTLPARPPEAVVCDLPALAHAPLPMTQAGFGDVMARSVSYGDWFLANGLGMDDGFSDVPGRLLDYAEQAMTDVAEDVAVAGPAGVRAVLEAVLLAGIAMSVVNQTAPISGWEHVLSHYLDLRAGCASREAALHGAQVGVGTVMAARAYERAWPALDVDRLLRDEGGSAHASARVEAGAGWAPDAHLREEIVRDYTKKLARWSESSGARKAFAAAKRRGEFDEFLARNVRSSDAVVSALRRAGAPTGFDELQPQTPPDVALDALLHAHTIRARFTLGDLLDFAGWLTPEAGRGLLR
jgi:glycerol-1-phosphate dehydrogenase [NAD(P)+]